MLNRFFKNKRSLIPKSKISYEDAKSLAKDANKDVRIELARRQDLAPEILYFMAEDKSPEVRQIIAANDSTPRHADLLLAKDDSEQVRESLAGKIARLAPGLASNEQDKLRKMTFDALSMLAKDQATAVREILSDALKEVADAPPEVIRRLAWDVEAAVATPVLRFSPVLTDQDLIEIIEKRPSEGAVSAISQRENLVENVTDAIVDSDDVDAIGLLLGNSSAQIREETLDHVIDKAVDRDGWHSPLAMRPKLPSSAAVKIARFVADDILKRMVKRNDLPVDVVTAVKTVVDKRLSDERATVADGADLKEGDGRKKGVQVDDDELFDKASKLWADGELNEKALMKAIDNKDQRYAFAIIAVMADMPMKVVERTCQNKSVKGCVALAWKAGLSPKAAEEIQLRLALLKPGEIIRAAGESYAMSEADLEWQLEFLSGL